MGNSKSCSLSHSLPFFSFCPQIPMVWKKPKTSENRQQFKMYLEGYRAGVPFNSGLKALYVLFQKNTTSSEWPSCLHLSLNFKAIFRVHQVLESIWKMLPILILRQKLPSGMIAYWYENLKLCLLSHSRLVQQTCPESLDWTRQLEFVWCQIIPNIKVLWKHRAK